MVNVMKQLVFTGIGKLEEILGENYKAIDTYNDFSIKYHVRHPRKKTYQYNKQLTTTFNRWVDMYKEQIRSKYDGR